MLLSFTYSERFGDTRADLYVDNLADKEKRVALTVSYKRQIRFTETISQETFAGHPWPIVPQEAERFLGAHINDHHDYQTRLQFWDWMFRLEERWPVAA